ncbi:hypothetical protein LTR37_004565 [Vermiconidia calcicola]|uniref:Uncharacterized protein n=1 Tax=Vermiconidia calcicola TaxID=1690605 RepID=A0ACC3NL60_9PEZI|nr:hypothetical protein LTR37_004565 [Vermiconidia calcicola]
MVPARPSSPTSLLWAHQLKREHGHLLKRMQDLESTSEKQENRIKSAEVAAKANASGEVAALAAQVKALDKSGVDQRLSIMERDVTRKVDDVQADSEAMTLQIAEMQKKGERAAEEERKKNLQKDKALLKRIGEVEEGLKTYEKSLDSIGKRINGTQFELIKQQLEGLSKQVNEEGPQMKMLGESVAALEAANDELRKANERLDKEVKNVASKSFDMSAKHSSKAASAEAQAQSGAIPETDSSRPKKSHKWSGVGADRDIVRTGSALFGHEIVASHSPASRVVKLATTTKKPPGPKKKAVPKKRAVPKDPLTPGGKKSHKWGGGGADRDIIQAGLTDSGSKRSRPVEDEPEPAEEPKKQKPRTTGNPAVYPGGKIVRAGKGWFEVEEVTPSAASEASDQTPKRGRGRPRKHPILDGQTICQDAVKRGPGRPRKFPSLRESEEELLTQNPGTRSTRRANQATATNNKRKADTAFGHTTKRTSGPASKKIKTVATSVTPEAELPSKLKAESNIYSSPVSSNSSPEADGASARPGTNGALPGVITSQPEKAPQRVKREIVQLDDDISAIVRQMSG